MVIQCIYNGYTLYNHNNQDNPQLKNSFFKKHVNWYHGVSGFPVLTITGYMINIQLLIILLQSWYVY